MLGICGFEIGLGISMLLYALAEAHAGTLAFDLGPELWAWFYVGMWIISWRRSFPPESVWSRLRV